jgi:hypothetical protein
MENIDRQFLRIAILASRQTLTMALKERATATTLAAAATE